MNNIPSILLNIKSRFVPLRYKSLLVSRSRRSIRFRKYISLILLLTLTALVYLNIAITQVSYLNSPILINTEDVTGISHLPTSLQRQISRSELKLHQHDSFDPRLMPALTLSKLTRFINDKELDLQDFQIPFSWADWLDLDVKLRANDKWYNYFNKKNFNCDTFKKYYKIGHDFGACVPLEDKDEEEPGFPQFKIQSFDDNRFPQEARAIMGASFLKFTATPPDRLIFLGVDRHEQVNSGSGALIVPTLKDPKTGTPVRATRNQSVIMSREFAQYESQKQETTIQKILTEGITLFEQVDLISEAISESDLDFFKQIDDFEITKDVVRIIDYDKEDGKQIYMTNDEFLFNPEKEIKRMKHKVALNGGKDMANLDYQLLKSMRNLLPRDPEFEKHFHESPIVDRPAAGQHYDWRFFNRLDIPYYEHVAVLHRMIRAWLRFSRTAGITTWVAHGTMLSWYWNGLNMPWDTDADVQVTMTSLYKLARNYHNSLVTDLTVESESEFSSSMGVGKFFIDVGPSFFSRTRGNGNNAIDARFVDTKTGLYIDITGLAFTDFYHNDDLKDRVYEDFLRVLDPDFVSKINNKTTDLALYDRELLKKKKEAFDNKEIFNCRNNHHYSLDELSPLIPTLYEGVKAYVPHSFKNILAREYAKGLETKTFWGHRFRPYLRLWVKENVCPHDHEGDMCRDLITVSEFKQTQHFTALHQEEMSVIENGEYVAYTLKDEFPPLRIDPWFIRHIKKTLGYLTKTADYNNAA